MDEYEQFDSLTDHEKSLWATYDSFSSEMYLEWLDENEDIYCLDIDIEEKEYEL